MRKRIILGFIISSIFIFFLFKAIDYTRTIDAIENFGIFSLIIGIIIYTISFIFRTYRWQLIIHPIKETRFLNVFYIIFISYLFNSVLPARIGDLIRGYLLTMTEDIKFITSISTVIFDRTLDGITLVLLFCLSLIFSGMNFNFDPKLKFLIILVIFLFTFLLLIYLLDFSLILKIISPFERISPKYSQILINVFLNFKSGGEILKSGKLVILKLFIYSIFIWVFEASLFYFVLYTMGILIPISTLFTLLSVVNFAIMIPSAPGYIGTFETAFVIVLVIYGINSSLALSAAIIIHIIWFITTILFGLISMRYLGVNIRQLIDKVKSIQNKN